MTYPYNEDILKLLQIETTPEVYVKARDRGQHFRFNHPNEPAWLDYIRLIPTYKYAQCPICGTNYVDAIDTYTVGPRMRYSLGDYSIYHVGMLDGAPCSHFAGVQSLMNYHGEFPDEEVRGYAEIPYVSGQLVNGVDVAYAVLHALPVCRIEGDTFVPRYTVFLVSYFATDVYTIYKKHYEHEYKDVRDDDYFPHNLVAYNRKYDLANLAQRGLLGWLDYTRDDLPLIIGEGLQLPDIYQNIEGQRYDYHWKTHGLGYHIRRLKRAIKSARGRLDEG